MKKIGLFLLLGVSLSWLVSACQGRQQEVRKEVPLDSIVLSDPCILADRKTAMYYMTGTGGMLWKSKDLKLWEGPFHVAKTDSNSWMGPDPMVWAAELHPYKGKYYYFATFTNQAVKIDTVQGNVIERRASHVLVSDKPDGLYVKDADNGGASGDSLFGERCFIDCSHAQLYYYGLGTEELTEMKLEDLLAGDEVTIDLRESEVKKAGNGSASAEKIQLMTQQIGRASCRERVFRAV